MALGALCSCLSSCGGGGGVQPSAPASGSAGNAAPEAIPAVSLALSSIIVPVGQSVALTWSSAQAQSCSASGDWAGQVPVSGTRNLTPAAAGYYAYTLSCTWPGGSGSQTTLLTAYGPTPSRTGQGGVSFHYADFYLAPPNQIVALQTSMTVPPLPPVPANGSAALFLWPGLQPAAGSANLLKQPGVLQPVLTWGRSCAPVQQPAAFSAWWISAEYYSPAGCQSGDAMIVEPGDVLLIRMALDPSSGDWTQTVTDTRTGGSVQFDVGLLGEGQNWIDFAIESWYGATMSAPLVFSDTTITFQSPDEGGWCAGAQGVQNAYAMTPPTPQAGGTQCTIARIVIDP